MKFENDRKVSCHLTKLIMVVIWISIYFISFSQTPGEWTWMAGSNSNSTAVYGIQGIPDPANTPGETYEGARWTDADGNIWYYGGVDLTQNLWKYDFSSNIWTWKHGPGGVVGLGSPIYGLPNVYSPTVLPGTTVLGNHAEWVDLNGDLWFFSGEFPFPNPSFSIWKFNIGLNQWAFVHGNIPYNVGVIGIPDPMNNPNIEESPISWLGNDGSLYMFDGFNGIIWKFDIVSNMWTAMHGLISPSNGILGQYNASNCPEYPYCRYQIWKSEDGTFYLFGGTENSFTSTIVSSNNKMWQFDPLINQWRVVHPGNVTNTAFYNGNYIFDSLNCPSSFIEQRTSWVDECNHFYGIDEGSGGYIFCFDPSLNQYALVEGTVQPFGTVLPPNFGTQGLSSPSIFPGTIDNSGYGDGSVSWVDSIGNFWKLGTGYQQTNALWRYVPDFSANISANFTASPQQGCFPLEVEFLPQDTSSTISFHWDFGDPSTLSDTSNSPTPSYTYTTPGTYTVELIVNGNGFCGTGTDTSEIIVTVVAPPVLNLISDTSVCSGASISLSVSGATSYSWSQATGLNTAVGAIVNASPTITTEYFVTGTTAGCSTTDSVTVTVHPLPQLQISDALICKGDTVSLTVTGAQTYTWSPATGLSTTTGANVQAFPSITSTYTIAGIDSNSCIGTKNVLVSVESITVNVNSDTICKNETNPLVTLTASGAQSYTWSPSAGLNSTSGNSVVSTANATTNYTVIGESVNGCQDSAQALVTVVPYFNVTVTSDSICIGETSLLIASGANSYEWYTNQGISLGTGSEFTFSPTATTEYRILGKVLSCVDTAYSSITVFPMPSANITAYPNPVSSTNPVVNLSTNSQGNTIKWLIGGDLISNLASFTHDFENAEPGNYIVQLVLENQLGCIDTISLTVIIEKDILFYIPNSFTPNSDEFNTVFTPIISSGIASTGYEFIVINRWGEIVFETNDIATGWDGTYKGKTCQDGTYVWKASFNSKYNSKRYEYNGHVNLLK